MPPEIRPARPADLPTLARLRAALCEEDGLTPFDAHATERGLLELLRDPHSGEIWVATEGDAAIAYLLLTWTFSLEFGGSCGYVDELYVLPSVRGSGVGTRLLALAEEQCRARGIAALRLEVERANGRAQELYRRVGYREHSRNLMTKWLSDPAGQS